MRLLFLTGFLFFHCFGSAQLAINDWRVHFPTSDAIAVAYGNDRVFCATPTYIYAYNVKDNGVERYSKNNLLTSTNISAMAVDYQTGTIVVGYADGNLDLIKDGRTTNVSSIKNSNVSVLKTINRIHPANGFLYLSCSFGIVVYDQINQEVKDTYIIGPGGATVQIWSTVLFDDKIIAATDIGLYVADLNNPFLADFNSWSRIETIPNPENEAYQMTNFFNKVVVAQKREGVPDVLLYSEDLENWTEFREGGSFSNLRFSNNKLLVCYVSSLESINGDFTTDAAWFSLGGDPIYPKDAMLLPTWQVCMAESQRGLVQIVPWEGTYEELGPQAPYSSESFALFFEQNKIIKTAGGPTGNWSRQYNGSGFDVFEEGSWQSFNNASETLNDASDISGFAIDPKDENHWFVASWGDGLLEMQNGEVINQFDETNSPLQTAPELIGPGVLSVVYDEDDNLWMSNGYSSTPVMVYTKEGEWAAHETGSLGATGSNLLGRFIIAENGYKWFIRERGGGMLVYDDNGTPLDGSDDQAQSINTLAGSGGLPTLDVLSVAEDLNGEIWVGTGEGIAVFYASGSVFSGGNFDAQQILIEQDGNIQILLETEMVQAIAIDGANQKWLGTQSSGVFLMSPDGTEQLQHFTVDNSPLPSNNILSIAIDGSTGEVYFGTEAGLVSYRSSAIDGLSASDCNKVFPNPVRENYQGPIAITGLARDTNVKITDLVGNLVFETTSEGGQAIWDGNDINGQRVTTGVYLALCTAPEGASKCVSKIMVVR